MVSPDAAPIEPLLREQWAALRAWIVAEGVLDRAAESSGLGAWTVGDLALAAEAWTALDAGLPTVVLGRRGPLRRDDFLLTRLLEVVTHGDDLHRLLRVHRPAPLLPIAVDRVAAVLTAGYRQRTDRQPPWTGIELIRVATGRTVTGDPVMPLLS